MTVEKLWSKAQDLVRVFPRYQKALKPRVTGENAWKPIREQGKIFSTLCFWCRAPVYFVENSNNGGCFLADRTPSDGGWKVHSCWLVNKGTDKSAVIRHYRQKIKEKKQLKNTQKNTNRTKKKKQIFD
uniref:Uncharacterized protein n=1 Tax=Gram-negative bacterium 0471 TaxID=204774 RepID=Q8GJI9_UNCXX|nr:hypothetical protein [Gram-negative bacterium 0471]AAQ10296.1 hypothetical protein [Gram-negative bacterium 0471]